jgi:hypothetical protein
MMQEALKEQDTQHPTQDNLPATEAPATQAQTDQTSPENQQTRTARLFLEDFVVTALLRTGRALSPSELSQSAEGFSLSRARLRDGLEGSRRIVPTIVTGNWRCVPNIAVGRAMSARVAHWKALLKNCCRPWASRCRYPSWCAIVDDAQRHSGCGA